LFGAAAVLTELTPCTSPATFLALLLLPLPPPVFSLSLSLSYVSDDLKLCLWCGITGKSIFLLNHHDVNKWKNQRHNGVKKCLGASIYCSTDVPSIQQLSHARLIYSVAPSMGHNQVSA